jgi:CelD/BcsL family acetyltransferase involved in cellulose biosynthesis
MTQIRPSVLSGLHINLPPETPADSQCQIIVASTKEEFDALEEPWNLLLNLANTTVYQTFEWLRTWWKYKAGAGDKLHILVFYEDELVVGIAPLYIQTIRLLGLPVSRRLTVIGTGLSDYVDFLLDPAYEIDIYDAFCEHLVTHRMLWDVFDIEDVNESSHLVTHLPEVLTKNGLNVYSYQGNVCPFILLPDSPDDLFKGLGATTGYNFRRKVKKLQSKFSPEIKLYQSENDDIEKAIRDFSLIHGERWKSMGYPSAFDDEEMQKYHVEFSRKLAQRGWLRLFILYIGDKPVAVSYSFNFRKRIYMYHSNAHGPDEIMRCSPGMVIRGTAMIEGIREGMEVFDYLRGNESYKYREMQAQDSKNYLLRVVSTRPATVIRFYLFLLTEILQKAVNRTRREYYGYRRFIITDKPTVAGKIAFAGRTFRHLLRMGYDFLYRHSPLRSIRWLAIRPDDENGERAEPAENEPAAMEPSSGTAPATEKPRSPMQGKENHHPEKEQTLS